MGPTCGRKKLLPACIKYSNYSNNFILEAKKAKKIIGDNYNSYLLW